MTKMKLIHAYCCRIESNGMNIVDGIISIIYEYHRHATWSKEFKGEGLKLTEDDTKVMCIDVNNEGHSIRADFHIERGDVVSWTLQCYQTYSNGYFYGVISSKEQDFNTCPAYLSGLKNAYGVDDWRNIIYVG